MGQNNIDFPRRDFSVVLVDPKPSLLDWLSVFMERKGLGKYRLYYPEGNLVLIVPKVDSFREPGDFQRFLDEMKPNLLRAELRRFKATPEDLGLPLTKETFDKFFTVSWRESALLMSDFN